MARRQFKWVLDRNAHTWIVRNPVTDAELVRLDFAAHVVPTMDNEAYTAMAYGIKQISSDGAAKDEGTPLRERIAALVARFNAWHSGAYAFRDGTGAAAKFPDADLFAALVGIGLVKPTDEARAKWVGMTAAQRNIGRTRPDVIAWFERNADADAAAAFDEFVGDV